MQNSRKAGFTLVELLVVIAIIALLMGIMLPALNIARSRAQTIVCASNLKNYGTALFIYAETNNDKAPFSFSWLYSMKTIFKTVPRFGMIPQACRWHYDKDPPDGTLWPYLRNIKVHMCPTFRSIAMSDRKCYNTGGEPVLPGMPPDRGHDPTLPFHPVYSYSMNRWVGLDWQGYLLDPTLKSEPSMRLSNIKRTTQCVAFSEENSWPIEHRAGDGGKFYCGMPIGKNDMWLNALKDWPDGALSNLATYHNVSAGNRNEGSANVVYVDGHVSLTKGLPGRDAYMEYGRPYNGHELQNIW